MIYSNRLCDFHYCKFPKRFSKNKEPSSPERYLSIILSGWGIIPNIFFLELNIPAIFSIAPLGFDFSLPYFPIGPVNMSLGGRLITFGFDTEFGNADDSKKIKSITIGGLIKTDLQPILNFFGDNVHPSIETGITYSLGWDENYDGGLGVVVGGTLDYWFEDSPLGVRLFGNGYMIPSPEDALTGFGNIGASVLLSLKRND